MAKRKLTEADLAAREESRRNGVWLRGLAEQGYADLDRRGKLAIRRPEGRISPPTEAEMKTQRERARANSAWLRELAEKAKADLDQRTPPDE